LLGKYNDTPYISWYHESDMDLNKDQKTTGQTSTGQQDANPLAPVGGVQKEQEPSGASLMRSSETEPVIPPEAAELGVENVSERPVLTTEQQEAGIKISDQRPLETATPPSSPLISAPLSEKESLIVLQKTSNKFNAIVWLADLILRQIKRLKVHKAPPGPAEA